MPELTLKMFNTLYLRLVDYARDEAGTSPAAAAVELLTEFLAEEHEFDDSGNLLYDRDDGHENNPYYTVAELADSKGVIELTIRKILRDPKRRTAHFPGATVVGGGPRRGVWLIPREEGDSWTPRQYTRRR